MAILEKYRWREKLKRRDYIEGMLAKLLPVTKTAKPKCCGIEVQLGNYWLKKKGNKAFLLDENNNPVISCNLNSVDGSRFKKKLLEKTGLPEAEIDKATASFQFAHKSVRKSHSNVEEK